MRENRFRQRFEINGAVKTYYPKSIEMRDKNLETAKAKGWKCVESVKLYPINMMKNQHNFDYIATKCANMMFDMENEACPWDGKVYDDLAETKAKAEKLFCLELPTAWVDGKTYGDAMELIAAAECFRDEAMARRMMEE